VETKKHREEVEIEEGEEIHYSIKTSAELLLQQKSAQINLLRDYLTKVQELKTLIEEQPYTDLVLEIYTEILDEISTEVCFDIHKQLKLGSLCLNCDSVLDFVDKPGSDVFGQLTSAQRSSNESFDCPHCSRPVIASRFAPHLEKCMGLGRNSSRIATRRISTKAYNGHSEESEESDDAYHEKNGKRVRTGKTSEKKKVKSSAVLTAAQSKKMQQTIETIKATHSKSKIQRLMETKCGVISQVTGKLCTKSLNCPQHTPEQRRLVRHHLLSDEIEEENQSAGFIASEDDLENE